MFWCTYPCTYIGEIPAMELGVMDYNVISPKDIPSGLILNLTFSDRCLNNVPSPAASKVSE